MNQYGQSDAAQLHSTCDSSADDLAVLLSVDARYVLSCVDSTGEMTIAIVEC